GTYVMIAGAAVSVLAALTGFWDWLRSSEKGTQARRTANTHAWTMSTVTVLAAIDIALRLNVYHTRTHPTTAILVLSIFVAALVSLGAAFGGTLVYDYGFNVESASDGPVWHQSETDVLPGEHVGQFPNPRSNRRRTRVTRSHGTSSVVGSNQLWFGKRDGEGFHRRSRPRGSVPSDRQEVGRPRAL
ncbi:MAG: DUF2231 domain-containing protein, partial [Acidimicrobiales bacterium]